MKTSRSFIWFVIFIVLLVAMALWLRKKSPVEVPRISSTETIPSTASAPNQPASAPAQTSTQPSQTATGANTKPGPFGQSKGEQIKEGLSVLNDSQIVFYGKLEDQFGNALGNTAVNFSVRVYNGSGSGVDRGRMMSDANGLFTISGYKGESLSVMPEKAGYALASLNGGGRYSYMFPEEQRAHPDPKNPVVIKMWKLQGAEPLVTINQRYKLPYTNAPIYFDLLTGNTVSNGGDVKITVNRALGIISARSRLEWGLTIEAVDGGLMESTGQERVTYWAPDSGYQKSETYMFSTNAPYKWFDSFSQGFFVVSRNGQVYTKLALSFRINEKPDGIMYVTLSGIANTNHSRNWEGDPNTMKPQ